MTRKRAGATRKEYHDDDLAFGLYGKRYFQNGEIQTLQELRREWKSSRQFREQVLRYAAVMGKTEADIYLLNDDGEDPAPRFKVCGPDGQWRWTTKRPGATR